MRCMLLAACIVLLAASEECSAGAECADKQNCAKKFGEKYEIEVSEQDPVFTGNEVIIDVKYQSQCADGGSDFTAHVMPKHTKDEQEQGGTDLLARGAVVYVHRSAASCMSTLPFEQTWSGIVRAQLGASADEFINAEYIAFPPGGKYDMFKLYRRSQ